MVYGGRDEEGAIRLLRAPFVRIAGQQGYLWRAVEGGNVLDILVQKTRDKAAAARFFKTLLRSAGYALAWW